MTLMLAPAMLKATSAYSIAVARSMSCRNRRSRAAASERNAFDLAARLRQSQQRGQV
jgi:hypothetical protein